MRVVIAAALAASVMGLAGQALAQDMDLMQFADGDKDGKVTLTEYTGFLEQGWMYFVPSGDKVKVADLDDMSKPFFAGIAPDADGAITKASFMAGAPARFKAADKNGDGTLDAAELNGTMKPAG